MHARPRTGSPASTRCARSVGDAPTLAAVDRRSAPAAVPVDDRARPASRRASRSRPGMAAWAARRDADRLSDHPAGVGPAAAPASRGGLRLVAAQPRRNATARLLGADHPRPAATAPPHSRTGLVTAEFRRDAGLSPVFRAAGRRPEVSAARLDLDRPASQLAADSVRLAAASRPRPAVPAAVAARLRMARTVRLAGRRSRTDSARHGLAPGDAGRDFTDRDGDRAERPQLSDHFCSDRAGRIDRADRPRLGDRFRGEPTRHIHRADRPRLGLPACDVIA